MDKCKGLLNEISFELIPKINNFNSIIKNWNFSYDENEFGNRGHYFKANNLKKENKNTELNSKLLNTYEDREENNDMKYNFETVRRGHTINKQKEKGKFYKSFLNKTSFTRSSYNISKK